MDFGMPTLIECENLEACCAQARRLGLAFVEINQSFPQYKTEVLSAKRLKALSKEYGVYFTIHADEMLNPFDLGKKIGAAYVKNFLESVDLALKTDVKKINMHLLRGIYVTLPGKRVYMNEVYKDEFFAKVRAFAKAVSDKIGDKQLKICIENTDGFLPYELEAIDIMLSYPCFGITLDVGHNFCINFADDAFYKDRLPQLCHMHLHDSRGTSPHLALGDGETDLAEYLKLAKSRGCTVLIEVKTVEGLEKSVQYINKNEETC